MPNRLCSFVLNPYPMRKVHLYLILLLVVSLPNLGLGSCRAAQSPSTELQVTPTPTESIATPVAAVMPARRKDLLQQSWNAYRKRFIQADGRVIDREANNRSTSEGQAYAMLRAVIIGDRSTFDKSLNWAENNLQRQDASGKRTDHLWSWQWGLDDQKKWTILDPNFASDADIDATTALILAAKRWNQPQYLSLARTKLQDLWNFSTVASSTVTASQRRYLLPGPAASFQSGNIVKINPSYLAPYAFRLFAQIDPTRDWLSLVDSSYQLLQQASALSAVKLPNDWVQLDLDTGATTLMLTDQPGTSEYGFDAYRVWWRVALDASWFREPRATQYLQEHLGHLRQLWRSQKKIPARIDLQGNPTVTYEATSQYGMLYTAMQLVDPAIAQEIEQQKILPQYRNGLWENDIAYYTQNLVWLGLVPANWLATTLQPTKQVN